MAKKSPKRKLQLEADALLQNYCRIINKKCEMCGAKQSCMHHFHTKGASNRLRYELSNLISVCAGCHLKFHSKFSADITCRLLAKRGIQWSEELLQMKREFVKTNIEYYRDMIEYWEEEINKLK